MGSMLLAAHTDRDLGIPITIAVIALVGVVIAFVQVLWVWPGRVERSAGQAEKRSREPGSQLRGEPGSGRSGRRRGGGGRHRR